MASSVLTPIKVQPIRAGDLRHRVTVQRRVTSQDTFGAEVESWATVAVVWAAVEPLIGAEIFAAQRVAPHAKVRVRMRWMGGLTPENTRLLFNGRVMCPAIVLDPGELRRQLDVLCMEAT